MHAEEVADFELERIPLSLHELLRHLPRWPPHHRLFVHVPFAASRIIIICSSPSAWYAVHLARNISHPSLALHHERRHAHVFGTIHWGLGTARPCRIAYTSSRTITLAMRQAHRLAPHMHYRTITLAMRRAHRLAPLVCTRIDILALVAIPITVFLATLVLMKLVLVTPVGILDHPAVLATNAHIEYSHASHRNCSVFVRR